MHEWSMNMTTTGTQDGGGMPPTSPTSTGSGNPKPYALRFSVDYPDRPLDKLSTALRILWVIPILFVLAGVTGFSGTWESSSNSDGWGFFAGAGSGIIFLAPLLMIVFRQKYPRWWWDFNVQLLRFQARVGMYFLLTTDKYPSTDEEQSVHLDADYPDVEKDLNRWLPLVKWLLALPHWIILIFLYVAAFFVLIYVWFVILFTGRYPRGAFDFIIGVSRWGYRVQAYALLLNTDVYPPFSLE
jgi:hypothetical protein